MRRMFTIEEIEDISGGGGGSGAVQSVNGKTGAVVLSGADIKADPDKTERINTAFERVDRILDDYGGQLATHDSEIAAKQDALTAGTNITIEDGVISADTGGTDWPYWPIYNIATFAEIEAAYMQERPTTLVYHPNESGDTWYMRLVSYIDTAELPSFYFAFALGNTVYSCYIDSSGYWSPVVRHDLAKLSDMVTSISSASTDSKFPTARAVYSYVASHTGPDEYIKSAEVDGNTLKLTDQDNVEISFTAAAEYVPRYGSTLPATGSEGDLFFLLEV